MILCEVHPSTELINRVGWSLSFSDPAGGRPGTTATRPLGEMGCFWTTFLEFDPSKLGISPSKEKPPGTLGRSFQRACVSCTSPISVCGLFRDLYFSLGGAPCCWTCAEARTSNKNKQATSNKQASITGQGISELEFDPSNLGVSPSKKGPLYIGAIFPTRLRFLHEPHFCLTRIPRLNMFCSAHR